MTYLKTVMDIKSEIQYTDKLDSKFILSDYKDAIIVLILYAALFCVISYFHEPWFDEAQAWEIGRTATYKDMMTVLPHTEGHPPLWSLILSVPAKLGVPYPIGLKGVSFVFSLISVSILEFKSPFPKIIKYILPFTYYIFYQYGVISRTYCILEVAMIIIAISFKSRNERPLRFAGSLYLLCLTSAYGILIAAGICLCWIGDIITELYHLGYFNKFYKDKRIQTLFVLFLIVLPLIYLISPYPNTAAANGINIADMYKRFFYFLFVLNGDSLVSAGGIPLFNSLKIIDIIPGLIASLVIMFFLLFLCNKDNLKYYYISYSFYCVMMSVYSSDHHMGICMIWGLSFVWATYDEGLIKRRLDSLNNYIEARCNSHSPKIVYILIFGLPFLLILASVYYNINTIIEDIKLPYAEEKAIAEFIKNHNMENAKIMVEWEPDFKGLSNEEINNASEIDVYETENTYEAVGIIAYFDKNIFFNHNFGSNKGYATHLKHNRDENENTYAKWRGQGIPEVLVGLPALNLVYKGEISISDYVSVAEFTGYYMGKANGLTMTKHVYVRKDCLRKYGLIE